MEIISHIVKSMKSQISHLLLVHCKIFKIFGYCSLSFKDNREESLKSGKCLRLHACLLMIVFNVMAFVSLFDNDEFLFKEDKFGLFNDTLKIIFADLAVSITYLESLLQRSSIYEFWLIYCKLQRKTKGPPNAKLNRRDDLWQNHRFLFMFYAVVFAETMALIVFFVFQDLTRHLILFWSVFTPFIFAVHLRNLQFVFYIELIRLELVKLQQDLSLMVDYSRFQAYGTGFKGFEEFLRSKIAEKQKTYQMIYEMYENFQKSFGFSIIAVLLMIYVRVVVDSYFGYYSIYRGWNKVEIFLLIPAFLQIPIFLITSKNCMDVVKFITLNLHFIISQFNSQNDTISVQLQNFSLQILHQRICINGIGITRMDGYMLTKAIGSVTTYMIFFIQFMPKFTNF